jgi:toxin HigB-1
VILNIRHKGLERFYRSGDTRGIDSRYAAKLRVLLTVLDAASDAEQIGRLPGARLHPLKGDRRGQWAIWVSANWRLVFRFEGEDVADLDLVDYH